MCPSYLGIYINMGCIGNFDFVETRDTLDRGWHYLLLFASDALFGGYLLPHTRCKHCRFQSIYIHTRTPPFRDMKTVQPHAPYLSRHWEAAFDNHQGSRIVPTAPFHLHPHGFRPQNTHVARCQNQTHVESSTWKSHYIYKDQKSITLVNYVLLVA